MTMLWLHSCSGTGEYHQEPHVLKETFMLLLASSNSDKYISLWYPFVAFFCFLQQSNSLHFLSRCWIHAFDWSNHIVSCIFNSYICISTLTAEPQLSAYQNKTLLLLCWHPFYRTQITSGKFWKKKKFYWQFTPGSLPGSLVMHGICMHTETRHKSFVFFGQSLSRLSQITPTVSCSK